MIISAIAILPITVSAATTNTTDYFAHNSNTGLDAYYGTPVIASQLGKVFGAINDDNSITTLKDPAWDNAYCLTVNSTTAAGFVSNSRVEATTDYDVWILWDENNLYFLSDVRYLKYKADDFTMQQVKDTELVPGQWGVLDEELCAYAVLLPRAMDGFGSSNNPASFFVSSVPCLNDANYKDNRIYEGVTRVRRINYVDNTGDTSGKPVLTWNETYANGNGIRSFVERLEVVDEKTTQYRVATVIPWTLVDTTADKAFASLGMTEKAGKTIGVKLYNNFGNHINHNKFKIDSIANELSADTAGHDPVTLMSYGSVRRNEDLYDYTSMTGLDAYYGSPTVHRDYENTGSIIDDIWYEKGLKFTLDPDTRKCYPNSGGSGDSDYYLLWDKDYLYILEIHRNLTITGNADLTDAPGGAKNDDTSVKGWTSDWTCSTFNIIMPGEMRYGDYYEEARNISYGNGDHKKPTSTSTIASHVISVPGVTENDAPGTTAMGVGRIRDTIYCHDVDGMKTQAKFFRPYSGNGITVKSQKTEDGYICETKINFWNICGLDGESFWGRSVENKLGQTIGMKIYAPGSGGYHLNNKIVVSRPNDETNDPDDTIDINVNQDYMGFDPVTLLAAKPTVADTGDTKPERITPDTDYWIGPNGLFTHPDTRDSVVYDINTAEQLLGLSYVFERSSTLKGSVLYDLIGGTASYDGLPSAPDRTKFSSDAEYNEAYARYEVEFKEASDQLYADRQKKYKLTKGKVFRLTADIDLNPGIKWENYQPYVALNSVIPSNFFWSLDAFYGTFDGQGHTISGIFAPGASNGSYSHTSDFGGLIGSIRGGGVRNVVIDNGYVCDYNAGGCGGVIGTVYPTDFTDDYALIELENITVGQNYHVVCAYKKGGGQTGGIFGNNWSLLYEKDKTVTVTLKDVSFCGQFDPGAEPSSTFGYLIGGWNDYRTSDGRTPANSEYKTAYFYLEMTDCVGIADGTEAQLNSESRTLLSDVDNEPNTTLSRCLDTYQGAAMPEGADTKWVNTSKGPMTITGADFLSNVKWQSTDVRQRAYTDKRGNSHTANTYDVRVISTVNTLSWAYAGFSAIVRNLTDGTSYRVENTTNNKVYNTLIAEGKDFTGGSFDVAGDYMYYLLIENLDEKKRYEIEVRTVLTRKDGTIVESASPKIFTPAPYDLEAAIPTPDIFEMVINDDGTAKNGVDGTKLTVCDKSHSNGDGGNAVQNKVTGKDQAPLVYDNAEFGRKEAVFNGINTAWEYNWTQTEWNKMISNGASFEMLIWFESMTDDNRPFSNQQTGGMGFNTDTETAGNQLNIAVVQTNKASEGSFAQTPVALKKYIHVVGVYDKVNNRTLIYIDGELAATYSPNRHPLGNPASSSDYWLVIGADSGGSSATTNHFNGKMIAANVYGSTLTTEQIRLLYANYYYN